MLFFTTFFAAVLLSSTLYGSAVSAIAIEPRAPPTTQHRPQPELLQCKPWKPKGVYGAASKWRGEILFYSDRTYDHGKDEEDDEYGGYGEASPRVANISSSGNSTEGSGINDTGESSSKVDDSTELDDMQASSGDDESDQEADQSTDKGGSGSRKPQHNDRDDEEEDEDEDEYDDDYGNGDDKHDGEHGKYLPGKAHNKAEPWRIARNKYQHYPFAFSNCTYTPLHLRPETTQSCSRGGCYRTYTVYTQIKSDDSCLTSSTYEPRKEEATFSWERCEYKDQRKARKQLFKLSQTVQYTHNFGKVVRYGDVDLQNIQSSYTQGPFVAWYIKPRDRKRLIKTKPHQYTQRGIYARVLKQ